MSMKALKENSMERKWNVYLFKLLLSIYFDVVLASNYALSSSV